MQTVHNFQRQMALRGEPLGYGNYQWNGEAGGRNTLRKANLDARLIAMNIALWLYQTAQLHPQRQALMRGMTLHASYAQFARRAATLAQWMQRVHGVQAGDRVALYMANCCEYLEVAYAVWWLGAVVVPINFKLHPSEAAWIVTDAQAKLVFSDTAMLGSCWSQAQSGSTRGQRRAAAVASTS